MKTIHNYLLSFALLFALTIFFPADLNGCTSAIFTGRVTVDGRPIMWKHRDTGQPNNRVDKYKGEKHTFIALVNSNTKGNSAWSGTNEAGLSIMNTASYNLNTIEDLKKNNVSYVMFQALSKCSTLAEFEQLLDEFRPLALEANIAVIDAQGGAAYYECAEDKWTKLDANDPKIAPQGYIAYTNHSFTGRFEQGSGYIRYNTAISIINEALNTGKRISPQWIAANLSRSFRHSLLGIDLVQLMGENPATVSALGNSSGYFIDQDFIPRLSSTSVTIAHGVKPGEDPSLSVMWTILGYPPLGIAIPTMVNLDMPHFITKSHDSENALICDQVLEIKARDIFNISRGNGQSYFNFRLLYNKYMKAIAPIEQEIFTQFYTLMDQWRSGTKPNSKQLTQLTTNTYNQYTQIIPRIN